MQSRRTVSSASPYEAMFGFCRALRVGDAISVAGTAPIGDDGRTVGAGDPAAQARRCFELIVRSVEALGGSRAGIRRTRMFLTRIDDWRVIGAVHGEFFAEVCPVSTMVEVSRLIDPDWLIEVEAEAVAEADGG